MSGGKIIVFSGLDGAGKSTQIELLRQHFQNRGRETVYLWTRGGYTFGFEAIKNLLRRVSGRRAIPESGHSPRRRQAFSRPGVRKLWLGLAILDLMWIYGLWLRWLRWRGKVVICDRYLPDTQIDFRLNFPQEDVENWPLWKLLKWATPPPDAAFLLLVPVAESVRRSDIKGEPFRDTAETLAKRLSQYERFAQSGFWTVLDGQRPIPELAAAIREKVEA